MNLRAFFVKKASDFAPMPCYSIRLLCVLLHLHCEPRSESEGVFEDGCFGKAYILVPALSEFIEDLTLFVVQQIFQVLAVPCYVPKEFFHLL